MKKKICSAKVNNKHWNHVFTHQSKQLYKRVVLSTKGIKQQWYYAITKDIFYIANYLKTRLPTTSKLLTSPQFNKKNYLFCFIHGFNKNNHPDRLIGPSTRAEAVTGSATHCIRPLSVIWFYQRVLSIKGCFF